MELATRSIEEIEVRLARIEAERDSLLFLRGAWQRYLSLDEAPTEQPGQDRSPAPAPWPPAVSSPPGDGSAAIIPDVVPPGFADCPECDERVRAQGLGSHQRKHKPGYRSAVRRSRAIEQPAAMAGEGAAVAPGGEVVDARASISPTQASGSEGTPAPAPKSPSGGIQFAAQQRVARERAAGPYVCGDCGRDDFALPQNVLRHRSVAHPGSTRPAVPKPRWHPEPVNVGNGVADGPLGSRESYICARCPAAFKTASKRDLHQTDPTIHPPIPDGPKPVGHNPTTRRGGVPAGVPIA